MIPNQWYALMRSKHVKDKPYAATGPLSASVALLILAKGRNVPAPWGFKAHSYPTYEANGSST